ncbi:class A beta-lactamase-related serine hydrolase [Nocardia sp. alder85J]|uniref:class A beta-lactamase-related serine hydrolase n=1 Tax=Nocardia sp. alder85J TaxID=2862949 RepID=UPI001CD2AABD|nr:class A beta-lactamase-related serine hydrolase [Nocardia sp. alder85J]MCX4093935.1 class A beta-lactamase-related serine hydrolase [Nocardia sp. alder85J]
MRASRVQRGGEENPAPPGTVTVGQQRVRLAGVVLCMLLAAACSRNSDSLAVSPSADAATSTTMTTGSVVAALPGTLAADFVTLQSTLNGHAGLAIMPVGADRMVTLGDWTTGPAWATIKVPLALAVQAANSGSITPSMSTAMTESDNSSADVLWQALGSADTAAKAVTAVLRQADDQKTTVSSSRTRSDYPPYVQTGWALNDQLRFVSHLPCLPNADAMLALLNKVAWNQQWGLAKLENTQFKSGWGADTNGNYLVRQFGIITTASGQIAVAIAAQANSGTLDAGTQIVTKLSDLVSKHLDEQVGGTCPKVH